MKCFNAKLVIMKILILSNLVSYTYNFRKEIIDALIEKGHEIVIACDNDSPEKHAELEKTCTLINVPFNGKGNLWTPKSRMRSLPLQ